ncbi:hypothetical protein GCM10023189_32370 [Nibrella saemangeumensis]|uniref:Integrase catalytic domain-containing protein n=1 Tax=Nibrella saemangeumensis TaxID=1084526 RepID=A0ABP8N3U0_9BACT
MIGQYLTRFAQKYGIELRYIQPSKPMQNGLVERLNLNVFPTIAQVQAALDECGAARAVAGI